mmetsp:Transcript_23715/g.47140  ORF Transcript_23715/g.47140 Transcript_23715/m.47140 type:complete len:294 (+) Transcript_23715:175-1056(+)|eukprot:CAMPEP_0194304776 /NCGR_PEP_ID=MMETSP0171-20130528/2408_1 /TAXON_ID=218684 /ORGANISM="Corethron pennatum, Strain L29A3" /LENGTH=293 /DNA_ID=CAMNT_0039056131 /DNA_START=140 /DNA_END=1021 /DNA_ORIENTATION=+
MNIDENKPFSIGTAVDEMNIDVSLDERIRNRRKSTRIPKPRKMIDVGPRLRQSIKKSTKKKSSEASPLERLRGTTKANKRALLKSKREIGTEKAPSKKEVKNAILQEQEKSNKQAARISKQVADGKLIVIGRKGGVIQLAKPDKVGKNSEKINNLNEDDENEPSKKMIRDAVNAMKGDGLNTKGKRIVISFQESSKEKLVTDPNADNTFVFNARGQIKEIENRKKKKTTRVPRSNPKQQQNLRRTPLQGVKGQGVKGPLKAGRGSFPVSTKQSKQRSTNARQNKFNQKRFLER